MSKTLAGLVISVSLASTPVVAAAENPSKDDPSQLVCKQEKKVNSRFTTKICFTRAQWDAIAEQNKRDYAENQSRHKIVIRPDR